MTAIPPMRPYPQRWADDQHPWSHAENPIRPIPATTQHGRTDGTPPPPRGKPRDKTDSRQTVGRKGEGRTPGAINRAATQLGKPASTNNNVQTMPSTRYCLGRRYSFPSANNSPDDM